MRVIIFGGAGFMGSNFVRYLINSWDDVQVLVYDKLTYAGRVENLVDIMDRIKFIRGDISDHDLLKDTLRGFQPDLIVNFAAETHVDRSINDPAPFIKTNVLGVFTILETLRKFDVNSFIHISTDEVYGDLWGKGVYADELHILNPSSPYSASKAAGDMLIMAYGRTYGVRYKIVRPSNNYGPYQHPEKLIPRTIIRFIIGKKAVIYGDGLQVRDWLYVDDFSRALDLAIRRGVHGEIYNVCAHNFASVKDIVLKLAEIMGKDPYEDVVRVKGRPGEDRMYAMRCDKIKTLGWEPLIGLNEGLRKTVEWYIANEWWWKSLLVDTYVSGDEPW
ncbi:MAG: dTDP-glucose 4,6-dehydratase [Thermoprotei archaeon]|nr:dTDP-glucose 4,6-dehydratase [Thermoprotei archaeon]